jgi:alkanesulfonate monooxygenase SsuD/methylene tetrahydromethanopterin reductase-like flavin-dependent oxidoreductase (luciferase family)
MKIGIGLPNTLPGIAGRTLVDWAVRAEERGFAGLATIDRIVYPSYDSLAALAAAAGATSRIGLMTNILLAPVYPAVLLAKTAASIDQLSGGRLTLGLGVGGRPDDFVATGRSFVTRGRDFDAELEVMHRAWGGESVGGGEHAVTPTPLNGRVPILMGGTSDQTLRRTVRWAEGWTAGGGGPQAAGAFAKRVREAWQDAGRDGEPRLSALVYFSLGDEVAGASRANLRHYYAFAGQYGDMIAEGALRTPEAIRDTVAAFRDLGFTEIFLDATTPDLDQIDRLADVVL